MKYRAYKVRTYEKGMYDEGMSLTQLINVVNANQEKIVHILPIGTTGQYVNIITLGPDSDE